MALFHASHPPWLRLVGVRTSYIHFSNISWTPRVLDPITNPFWGPSSWLHLASVRVLIENKGTWTDSLTCVDSASCFVAVWAMGWVGNTNLKRPMQSFSARDSEDLFREVMLDMESMRKVQEYFGDRMCSLGDGLGRMWGNGEAQSQHYFEKHPEKAINYNSFS